MRETKRRRERELAAVTGEKVREQKVLLDAALNNMRDGLMMFNKDNRAVVLNRRMVEMYALSPETAKPGCTLRELLEQFLAAGMYTNNVDPYIEDKISKGCVDDRTFDVPDGRAIRVVNQRMSDGGWVSTHEDVTERKNFENQLIRLNSGDIQ